MGGDLRHTISKLVSLGIPEVCLLKVPWESITQSKAVKSLRFCLTRKPPLFHGSGGKGDSGVRAGGCSSSVRAGSWGPSSQGRQRPPGEPCISVMTVQEIPELMEPGLL